jgi:soluble lytic murein transglycosylase-like protein
MCILTSMLSRSFTATMSNALRGLQIVAAVAASLLVCGAGVSAESENKEEAPQVFLLPRTVLFLPPGAALKRQLYLDMLEQHAREQTVPAELVDAVAFVESAYDPSAIGQVGEIGIMQVRPSTAAILGFKGNQAQLADADTNIRYGVRYLAGALQLATGDLCRALMKYRAGYGEEVMSARSVEYCRRVRDHLAALGSPLATVMSVPLPTVFPVARAAMIKPTAGSSRIRPATPAERSRQFWTAHEARVRTMTFAVRAKWARLAQHKRG